MALSSPSTPEQRAEAIARSGSLHAAVSKGRIPQRLDVRLSEAVVLGLIQQDVRRFIGVFGHGSTDIGEILRIYEAAGVVRMFGMRHETAAVHAAAALGWTTGEKAAVITSIGPGALHALAGSLMPVSNGIGLWFLIGDETSEDEGPNMQQIPGPGQAGFLRLFSKMAPAYSLHTPAALPAAMVKGLAATGHPYRPSPFFLLLPMNTQPAIIRDFNLRELPSESLPPLGPAADNGNYREAARIIHQARRVVIKVGGGARHAREQLMRLMSLSGGVTVCSPLVPGLIPHSDLRNMTVGGSKGSLSGNFAMEHADVLVSIGSRFVCQSDCSRTGYPRVRKVININADAHAAVHYRDTIPLIGDAALTLDRLNAALESDPAPRADKSVWLTDCQGKRLEWDAFRERRYASPILVDERWEQPLLTQPAVIKTALDWASRHQVIRFFDAGDVQANGFQIVEDDAPGMTFTDTGASYMGFAVSALMATAMTDRLDYALALTGDGSFTMNPQILIDGTAHGARGCILLLDNRSMGAIVGLQKAQYGAAFATSDEVRINYAAWANAIDGVLGIDGGNSLEELADALDRAISHPGISLVHVRVYGGDDPLGGMGVFGRWNVGDWCADTQRMRHDIGM